MTAFATMLDATSNTARADPAQALLKMNEGTFNMAVTIGVPIIHYDTKPGLESRAINGHTLTQTRQTIYETASGRVFDRHACVSL